MNKLIFLSLVFCSFVARGSGDAAQPKKATEAEGKIAQSQQPLTLKELMKMRGKSFVDSDDIDSAESAVIQLLVEKALADLSAPLTGSDSRGQTISSEGQFIRVMLKKCYGEKTVNDLISELYAMREAKRLEIHQNGGYRWHGIV